VKQLQADEHVQGGDGELLSTNFFFFRGLSQWIFYPQEFVDQPSRISLSLIAAHARCEQNLSQWLDGSALATYDR